MNFSFQNLKKKTFLNPAGRGLPRPETNGKRRRFLQPLAVAVFCAVFIALILVMGVMDLRRSDLTLQGFMENQGLNLIGVVQRLAQENLESLIIAHRRGGVDDFEPLENEAFLPHKWLTNALAEAGRKIDDLWKAKKIDQDTLTKYAQEQGIWLIALLDRRERAVLQSRSPQAMILEDGTRVSEGKLNLNRIKQLGGEQKLAYLLLRRADESGTVLIVLTKEDIRYWITRISVEKALEKIGEGQGQGLLYLVLLSDRRLLLGRSGPLPAPWPADEMDEEGILQGKRNIQSRKIVDQGKNILDLACPLTLQGKIVGIARLGIDLAGTEVILKKNRRNLFIFMSFIVAVALLAMWFLYRTQNRHLAGIVEMERRLEKAERLSSLGQLAAGVAHEIRNPLNAISMASQRLRREFMPEPEEKRKEFDSFTGIIKDEINRLDGIIDEFLSFSRSRRLELRSYPVEDVVGKIIDLIGEEAKSRGIKITTHWGGRSWPVPMDLDKLKQALLNLFKNAMESIAKEGAIRVEIRPDGRDFLVLSIEDTGCGMAPAEMEQIFSPDYTTKEKGLGLGLSLAHEIIKGHGGEIGVTSSPGKGTRFEVILPAKKTNGKD